MRQPVKKTRRPLKVPTVQSLGNIAEHYLSRFATTEAGVRRVLDNRIRRSLMANPDFAADQEKQALLQATITTIIEKYKRLGVLNDAAYADMKRVSLRRQGHSRNIIKQKLHTKGVASTIITDTLADETEAADDGQDVELTAAMKWAKRKKLGPFAATKPALNPDIQRKQARKHSAAMARAGFTFDIIKQVLAPETTVGGDDLIDDPFNEN